MLNKTESKIMSVIYSERKNREAFLISPADLINISGEKGLSTAALEKIMDDLSSYGYFDLIYSDRRGERVYCVTLTEKGKGYARGVKVMKRNLLFRLGVTVVLAVISFIIGLILKAIF